MLAWRCRTDAWIKPVSEAVEDKARRLAAINGTEGDDCFQRSDRFKHSVHSSAATILGVTGGKMRPFNLFHLSSSIKWRTSLRLVKAALRVVYARQAVVDVGLRVVPLKAMQ